jgi:hypothetical protein
MKSMNTNSEHIVQYWGDDNLEKIPQSSMDHLLLPIEAKEFLSNVGVVEPSDLIENSLGISFDAVHKHNIVTLGSHFDSDLQENNISESLSSWALLGHCHDKLICINADDGSVIKLEGEPETGFIDWFVNSSIEQYVLFITLAIQSFENGVGETSVALSLQQLTESLPNADLKAMRKCTHWWPIILSDIATGSLE